MVWEISLVSVNGAMGAARLANRNWRDVELIFPLIEPFLKVHGRIPSVTAAFLTPCECAIETYPVTRIVRDLYVALPRSEDLPAGWRPTTMVARLSGRNQQFAQKTQPRPPAIARELLVALDVLVHRSDRRATEIQTGEAFKDRGLACSCPYDRPTLSASSCGRK